MKAYEAVLAIDPDNVQAVDYLRQMYEKRRDWEKLLGLQRREAERMRPGPQRAAKFLEIAKLATERVKKPEVCIELWREVSSNDESNAEALGALAGFYERAKDFDEARKRPRAAGRASTFDATAKIQVLTKLGTIYGERLNNDEGAVGAWRALLALDPNDRRAQEALKKKYLALGRWDDLEVFYAESGKWDEFIRVLEQQEAKETNPQPKIALLFKIAQLWADKKQKLDRAAKAYEKVLELEPHNLRAAEALIPIYTRPLTTRRRWRTRSRSSSVTNERPRIAKLELYREVAALYEGKVKDPQKAFERYLAAFELAPGDARTSGDVERAAKATSRWDEVVAAYQRAIDAADAKTAKTTPPSCCVCGSVACSSSEVQRVDEALAVYRAVYEADGENAEAIAALEAALPSDHAIFRAPRHLREEARSLAAPQARRSRSTTRSRSSTRRRSKTSTRRSRPTSQVLDDEPNDVRRARRPRRALRQLGGGSRTSTCSAGGSSSTSARPSSST